MFVSFPKFQVVQRCRLHVWLEIETEPETSVIRGWASELAVRGENSGLTSGLSTTSSGSLLEDGSLITRLAESQTRRARDTVNHVKSSTNPKLPNSQTPKLPNSQKLRSLSERC